jgi:DNA-binding winged helix-turn-helix (wHTH) protein
MKYQFSDCVLDSEAFSLMRGGEAVPVEPQVFDLLLTQTHNAYKWRLDLTEISQKRDARNLQ